MLIFLSPPLLQLHKPQLLLTPPRNPKPLFGALSCPSLPTRCLFCARPVDSTASPDDGFESELERLLDLLPAEMRRKATEHPEFRDLVEVVMDLGRKPIARFPTGDVFLSDCHISFQDLQHATSQVGDFAVDNRAGISRTLHRISAIRNRKDQIIGLTCRVGRAVPGSASLLTDLVQDGASLLLIGPPGVGKTTIIREVARMLANDYGKRVMIVDTSNEIGGDGDIPHAGIGNARRMQVPNSDMQHKVLIEAVENHMPQVIVIDEIGTKLEAMAASTIAQRGIQLVATAHGITIQNLIRNPSLDMLIGGVESVTLGDEEASRRGVQKTVLERKGRSTFSCGVEIVSKSELRVHRSLEATVDAILSGRPANVEVRKMSTYEEKGIICGEALIGMSIDGEVDMSGEDYQMLDIGFNDYLMSSTEVRGESSMDREKSIFLFVYGIVETSVVHGIRELELDSAIQLTTNISEADALLASQSKLKKNSRIHAAARSRGIPIYVTKTSSLVQITKALRSLISECSSESRDTLIEGDENVSEIKDALEEARIAIEKVVIPKGESVELLPRPSHILTLQMDLIQNYQLEAERLGIDPNVRIRIHPLQSKVSRDGKWNEEEIEVDNNQDITIANGDVNGSPYIIDRLPLLEES